jgi:UDP-N-acetylmuramoyl-tripeptide--D-alanyl-D-alanine ligase
MATRLPENVVELTVAEVLAATEGMLAARGVAERATSVSTNTRELASGAVFVALRGKVHDGHAHVRAAAEAGAALAVVEREVDAPPSMSVVRVGSTLRALGDLARLHVERWHALCGRTVIAITGSAGKTTTRVATAALVESLFPGKLTAARGNLNNRIGVPMVLFSVRPEHEVAVLELGTSEPGEIAELCRMARPDVGILTLVAAAHVEGLGSIDGVAFEKAALFRSLSRDGVAVGNGDDARVRHALEEAPCARRVTYGRDGRVRILERAPIGMTRSRVTLSHADGRRSTFETPLVGEAGALACAAAVSAVEAAFDVQLDGDRLTGAFGKVEVGEGAQRLVPLLLASGLAVIDDTYNANPASMSSSIRAAAEMAAAMKRELVLVLGEMRELGSEAARGHDEVGRVAAESGARLVIAVGAGETPRITERARDGGVDVLLLPSVDDGLAAIVDAVPSAALVLVKGSRSVGTESVVAELVRRHGGTR